MPPQGQEPTKKSKKGLIIGLVAGGVGLFVCLFVLLFVFVASSRLQDAALADAFMNGVTKNDPEKAFAQTDKDPDNHDFINGAATALKDASFKRTDMTQKDDKGYVLFSLTKSDFTSARVVTSKVKGHRVVTSFVYSKTPLSLIPEASSSQEPAATEQPAQTAPSAACFAPSDYDTAFGYHNTVSFTETSPQTTPIHFVSDSLDYSEKSISDSLIKQVATIVTTNPGKAYTIHLQGSVATRAKNSDFAKQRAERVKADLVRYGVDANAIIIDTPQNIDSMGGPSDETTAELARSVVIRFIPGCSTDQ